MAEEENPFQVKKRRAGADMKNETDEPMVFDFMARPDEKKGPVTEPTGEDERPHYESAGTPIWDRNGVDTSHLEEEVVEHKEKKKKEV